MRKVLLVTSLSTVLGLALVVAGCAPEQSGRQPATSPEASQGHEGHQHGEADHAMHGQSEDALAELSPEDRALAEKQKTCPVSGEPLGAMGKPYKVTVQGREVFLCCPGCEAKIKENPKEYLAKLPQ